MNKRLIFGVALLALGASLTSMTFADPGRRTRSAEVLPPHEIVMIVRGMGLGPIGEPSRRGNHYLLHALNPRGERYRIVADARMGDILAMTPARSAPAAQAPSFGAEPRIIHVPKNNGDIGLPEANARYGMRGKSFYRDAPLPVYENDLPPYANDDADLPEAYGRPERATGSPPEFEARRPARAIDNVPALQPDRPNWIKPTPRWTTNERFDHQSSQREATADSADTSSPPERPIEISPSVPSNLNEYPRAK